MTRVQFMPWLLFLSVAILQGCSGEADFSGDIEVETLSAEAYQEEIVAIDRLVFGNPPLGEAGPPALRTALDSLSERVAEETRTKFGKVESLELKLLAKRAGRLSGRGDAASLRNDWMRIRNNLFDDRAWFARSADDLEYAAAALAESKSAKQSTATTAEIVAGDAAVVVDRSASPSVRGRWRITSVSVNGAPSRDEELEGAIWTFNPPQLTMRSARGVEEKYNFLPEGNFLRVTNAAAIDGWMLYERLGDRLRIAFYDGLGEKPDSFEPQGTRRDPVLVTVELEPAP